MQDLMMDIFILCMLLNQRDGEEYSHDYRRNTITMFRHVNDKCLLFSAGNEKDALVLRNYLDAVLNGSQGDESIWQ